MAEIDLDENSFLKKLQDEYLQSNLQVVLDNFLSELQRLESLFMDIDPTIKKQEKEALDEIIKQLEIQQNCSTEMSQQKTVQYLVEFIYDFQTHKILGKSKIEMNAFFMYIFSAFDAFLRCLLKCIYSAKPELTLSVKKEITIKEISKHKDNVTLINTLLEEEISGLLRESYIEQFRILETKFSVKLREFAEWKYFVEISQRRNIIVHCDGLISDQYITTCTNNGFDCSEIAKKNKVFITSKYLVDSISTMKMVATMLTHTLWRKVLANDLENADIALNQLLYEQLRAKDYAFVDRIGRFAFDQKKKSSDLYAKLFSLNRCIALKRLNKTKEMNTLLKNMDLTATNNDFLLAKEVLLGNIDDVVVLLRKIGNTSDLIKEYAYLEWPLFDDLRDNDKFKAIYKEIYGKDLSTQVNNLLTKTIADEVRDK